QPNPVADLLAVNGDAQQIRVDALADDHRDDEPEEEVVDRGADLPDPIPNPLAANGDGQEIRVDALGGGQQRDDQPEEEVVDRDADQPNPVADLLAANGDGQEIRVGALGKDLGVHQHEEEVLDEDHRDQQERDPLHPALFAADDGGDGNEIPVIDINAAEVPRDIHNRGVDVFEEEDGNQLEDAAGTAVDWHKIVQDELPYGHLDDEDLRAEYPVKQYIQDKEEQDSKSPYSIAKDDFDADYIEAQNERFSEIELEVATLESDIDRLKQDSSSFKSYFSPIHDEGKLQHKRVWLAALQRGFEETQLSLSQLSFDLQDDGREDLNPTLETLRAALDEAQVQLTSLGSFFDSLAPLNDKKMETKDIAKDPSIIKQGFEITDSSTITKGSVDSVGEEDLEEKLTTMGIEITKLITDIESLEQDPATENFKLYFSPKDEAHIRDLQHRRMWLNHLLKNYNGFNELQKKLDILSFEVQESEREDLNSILESLRAALDESQLKIYSLESFFDSLAPDLSLDPSTNGFTPIKAISLPSFAKASQSIPSADEELTSLKSKSGLMKDAPEISRQGPIDRTKTIYDEITIPSELKPKLGAIPEEIRRMEKDSDSFYYTLYSDYSDSELQEEHQRISDMISNIDNMVQQLDQLDAELISPEGDAEGDINAQKHTIGVYKQLSFEAKRKLGEDLAKVKHVITHRHTPEVVPVSSNFQAAFEGDIAEPHNIEPVSSGNVEPLAEEESGVADPLSKARVSSPDTDVSSLEDIRSSLEEIKLAIDKLKIIGKQLSESENPSELDLTTHERRLKDQRTLIEENRQKLETLEPYDSCAHNPKIRGLRSTLVNLSIALYEEDDKFISTLSLSRAKLGTLMPIANPSPIVGDNPSQDGTIEETRSDNTPPSALPMLKTVNAEDVILDQTGDAIPSSNPTVLDTGNAGPLDQPDPLPLHHHHSPSSLADLIRSIPEPVDALISAGVGLPNHGEQNQEVNKETPVDARALSMHPVPHEAEDTQHPQVSHPYEALLSSAKALEVEVNAAIIIPYTMLTKPKNYLAEILSQRSSVIDLQARVKDVKEQFERISQEDRTALPDSIGSISLPALLKHLEESLESARTVLRDLRLTAKAVPLQPLERISPFTASTPGSIPPTPSVSKGDKIKLYPVDLTLQRKPLGVLTQQQALNTGNRGAAPGSIPQPIKYAPIPTRPGELEEWVVVPSSAASQPAPKPVVRPKPTTGILSGIIGSVQYLWDGE
ncbi:MAG: hypothetical protein K2P93_01220, partial [Alphaproteobacteria bacterium]|nr:hypothetical protein [Alphaproteobacteria bacterium]